MVARLEVTVTHATYATEIRKFPSDVDASMHVNKVDIGTFFPYAYSLKGFEKSLRDSSVVHFPPKIILLNAGVHFVHCRKKKNSA